MSILEHSWCRNTYSWHCQESVFLRKIYSWLLSSLSIICREPPLAERHVFATLFCLYVCPFVCLFFRTNEKQAILLYFGTNEKLELEGILFMSGYPQIFRISQKIRISPKKIYTPRFFDFWNCFWKCGFLQRKNFDFWIFFENVEFFQKKIRFLNFFFEIVDFSPKIRNPHFFFLIF